jgi:hypothetical protein
MSCLPQTLCALHCSLRVDNKLKFTSRNGGMNTSIDVQSSRTVANGSDSGHNTAFTGQSRVRWSVKERCIC